MKPSANAMSGMPRPRRATVAAVSVRLPWRAIKPPVKGIATKAPIASISSAMPSLPSLRASRVWISASRGTQLA
jgi:hypothetical protein